MTFHDVQFRQGSRDGGFRGLEDLRAEHGSTQTSLPANMGRLSHGEQLRVWGATEA